MIVGGAARRPPGPKGRPLIGVYSEFRAGAPEFLERCTREYGDLVYFRIGGQQIYLVNHPDWIRDVLVTHQSNFHKSRMLERAKVLLGEGLLTSEGEFHTRQRRLVQPAFHRERLAGYAEAMVTCAARVRDQWEPGATYDISKEMMRLTLAIVARTLFSANVESEADEIGAALTQVFDLFETVLMPFSSLLEKLPLPSVKRFERARARLDQTIYRIIAEHRASGDQGDLLSMLLDMPDKQLRDEALTLFLAGHETTANALTWTFYLLSQNPDVEARLHEEVDRVLGGRAAAFEDLPDLRYTEMVISEGLRMFPPAWAIGRRTLTDYRVGNYTLPARSILLISPYVLHRDARWFPDPEKFDPERWQPDAAAARPKFSYVPFGGGARVCIGERFAWMEGVLLLATIAQKRRLRLEAGHKVATKAVITLRPRFGMRMVVS